MARIQLRDTSIFLQDGLAGTALINQAVVGGETLVMIDTISLNTDVTDLVPVGARFTISTEPGTPVHTVTARTPVSAGPTTDITFTPALAAGPADNDSITFLPQRVEVKIGDGDLSWTEAREMIYDLDRDRLDTVRTGAEQPVEVDLNFVFEFVKTEAGQKLTPIDVLKRIGEASEFVSSSSDLCEPFAIDILVIHCMACGTDKDQDFLFQDFRWESLDYSIKDAAIAVSGKCNITDVVSTRDNFDECA